MKIKTSIKAFEQVAKMMDRLKAVQEQRDAVENMRNPRVQVHVGTMLYQPTYMGDQTDSHVDTVLAMMDYEAELIKADLYRMGIEVE